MALEMFPLPQRGYIQTGTVRLSTSGYRTLYRLLMLLIGLQLITLAVVLAGVMR
jgi:hypothetical protein